MRPSWDLWFSRIATTVAQRGSCQRKQVGAVLVRDRDRAIVSAGYNGAPRGLPDCFEVGCDVREIDGRPSCVRTLHAESNALDRAPPLGGEPHTLYCNVFPCRNCALRIMQHPEIKRVVYSEYYESQGSREVAALFSGRDVDTTRLLIDTYGYNAVFVGVVRAGPRVRLDVIDLATGIVNGHVLPERVIPPRGERPDHE